MCDLTDLHDATLKSIAVDVDAGTVVLALVRVACGGAPERVSLIAHGWTGLSCPKQDPWGHSKFWHVNEARGPFLLASGQQRLEVEMQSGDIIEVEAATVERIESRHGARVAG